MTPQSTENDMIGLLNLPAHNPWWNGEPELANSDRTNFYWHYQNAQQNALTIIPGPNGTAKTTMLRRLARRLINDGSVENPRQVAYIPCSDPVSRTHEEFLPAVIDRLQRYTVPGSEDEPHYILLDDVHAVDDWRRQLSAVVDEWNPSQTGSPYHFVATIPARWLVTGADGNREIPNQNPVIEMSHLTQKFRDALFSYVNASETGSYDTASQFQTAVASPTYPVEQDDSELPYKQVRDTLESAIIGEASATDVATAFTDLQAELDDLGTVLVDGTEHYLTYGGFDSPERDWSDQFSTDGDEPIDNPATVFNRVESALRQTIFEELPRLAEQESSLDRIERPAELHSLCALLARRRGDTVNYRSLADTLDCDTRTLKSPYLTTLTRFNLLIEAKQYDMQRHRDIDLFFRSPGYLSALQPGTEQGSPPQQKPLRHVVADHTVRRFQSPLYFWEGTNGRIDYLVGSNGYRLPIMLNPDAPEATLAEFDDVEPSHRENGDINLALALNQDLVVPQVRSERIVEVPVWCYLLVC